MFFPQVRRTGRITAGTRNFGAACGRSPIGPEETAEDEDEDDDEDENSKSLWQSSGP
jgi:hypothetical protein